MFAQRRKLDRFGMTSFRAFLQLDADCVAPDLQTSTRIIIVVASRASF